MSKNFFFYDLETSGVRPRESRIMQFAGQRTDFDLKPIGPPVNHLIKLTNDILPDPEAILLTGITPEQTIKDGMNETEFLELFYGQIATPDTVFVGFNSIRFDDEFMRYLNYRNFRDPYEWEWKDGRSRWDLFDVVRIMRALRPDGINWPKDAETNKPVNRLELLAGANKLSHDHAHDALSDVMVLIELAKLVKAKQPKLFSYFFDIMTSKEKIAELVLRDEPFIYCSGKYDSQNEKTTVVATLAAHPKRQAALVFDLRNDPEVLASLSEADLLEEWLPEGKPNRYFPIKTLMFNRCPAIAPVGVLDRASEKRLNLDMSDMMSNFKKLQAVKADFSKKILTLLDQLDKNQDEYYRNSSREIDWQLYDGFFSNVDKFEMNKVIRAQPDQFKKAEFSFSDKRLIGLLPLYVARNFPEVLDKQTKANWDKFRKRYLLDGKNDSRAARFFNQLSYLSTNKKLTKDQERIVAELKTYGDKIVSELAG